MLISPVNLYVDPDTKLDPCPIRIFWERKAGKKQIIPLHYAWILCTLCKILVWRMSELSFSLHVRPLRLPQTFMWPTRFPKMQISGLWCLTRNRNESFSKLQNDILKQVVTTPRLSPFSSSSRLISHYVFPDKHTDLKIIVFRDDMPYSLVGIYRRSVQSASSIALMT